MQTLYAIDVETSGIDPHKSSLLSIGAVNINNPQDFFYIECRPWEGAEVHEEALKVNGFSHDEIMTRNVTEAQAIKDFFQWLKAGPMMIAHNSAFDSGFIAAAALRADLPNPFSFRTIDIHSIVHTHITQKGEIPPGKLSLNTCLEYLGLPREPDPHNALTGAQCNYDIYNKIINYVRN